jgi:hypothetical protein
MVVLCVSPSPYTLVKKQAPATSRCFCHQKPGEGEREGRERGGAKNALISAAQKKIFCVGGFHCGQAAQRAPQTTAGPALAGSRVFFGGGAFTIVNLITRRRPGLLWHGWGHRARARCHQLFPHLAPPPQRLSTRQRAFAQHRAATQHTHTHTQIPRAKAGSTRAATKPPWLRPPLCVCLCAWGKKAL